MYKEKKINDKELIEIANTIIETDFTYRGMCWQGNSFAKCYYNEPINCQSCLTAKSILDKGYHKIAENEVVISKEEYERLKRVETEKDRLYEIKLDLENQLIQSGLTEYIGADEIEKQARKETAREILETVKELYTTPYSCFRENILKVAEKYEVDVDEQRTKCEYFREIDYGYRHSKQCYAQKCAPEVNCNGLKSLCTEFSEIRREYQKLFKE